MDHMTHNAETTMATEREQVEARLRERVAPMIARAIGKQFCVRLDSTTKVRGIVTRCEFDGVRCCGRSWIAQSRVWLTHESGTVWGPYVVEALPK